MPKRLISALVLIIYSAILIKVVVFKGRMRLPAWAHQPQEDVWVHLPGEDRDIGERQGRGRADQRGGRGRGTMGPTRAGPADTPEWMIRFSPRHANFVPFKTILPQIRGEPRWTIAIINLVGNTVLFMPVGLLVPLVFRKVTWQKSLALAVTVGLMMEGMEGVLRVGIVDVDDVILNACGVMSGYGVFRLSRKTNTKPPARNNGREPASPF